MKKFEPTIDLNCDLGESYGRDLTALDHQIMPWISSCQVACGFHSGDPLSIRRTLEAALSHGLRIGAHPSYPDLQGFGRRRMYLNSKELEAVLSYQVCALGGMLGQLGGELHHVKLHGALYHDAARDSQIATTVVQTLRQLCPEVRLYGLADSALEAAAEGKMAFWREAFADRRYGQDGQLLPRSEPDALLAEPAQICEQVRSIALEQQVCSVSGGILPLHAETICLHGDTPQAVALAKAIHQTLLTHGIRLG